MSTDKVIFVGERWRATGSNMTGSDVTGSHVTGIDHVRTGSMLCVCASGSFAIPLVGPFHRKWRQWPEIIVIMDTEGMEGCARANRKLCNIPLVGHFHGSWLQEVTSFSRAFFLVVVQNVGWGCSLRRPRLHLSLVICPFYFHNYIQSLLFSDMLCSTPRMVFLRVKWMKCVIFS